MNETVLSDGSVFRWGAITGDITILGEEQTVVIGVFELPSHKEATFTFALHAGNKNPPVALSFGNLDPNEEMLKVIMENKGEWRNGKN